jgi:hypothetical protein
MAGEPRCRPGPVGGGLSGRLTPPWPAARGGGRQAAAGLCGSSPKDGGPVAQGPASSARSRSRLPDGAAWGAGEGRVPSAGPGPRVEPVYNCISAIDRMLFMRLLRRA